MIKGAIHMGDAELLLAILVIRLGGHIEFTSEEMQNFMGGRFEVKTENNHETETMMIKVRKVEA